jgi:NadR type nicotinamide-nucleotide adenylyltransferase
LKILRISITGPESTGKSELAENLAKHFHTQWVPEFARTYLNNLNREYRYEDLLHIAKNQLAMEKELAKKAKKYLFCDTDLLVIKIWSLFKYQKCDPWIEQMVRSHRYDIYLLCNIDLPWEDDPLREHPGQRKELLNLYIDELKHLDSTYSLISGSGSKRIENAISVVEKALTGN